MRPNSLSADRKIKWLCDIEDRIYNEIYLTHKHDDIPFTDFDRYGENTTLFAPPPYDELYVLYLLAMTDFYHAEYDRYNNDIRPFESLYSAFSALWHREHEAASEQMINK